MMPYTQEQIEKMKEKLTNYATICLEGTTAGTGQRILATGTLAILAALEAAQKDRDELKESLNGMSDAIDVTKIWTDRCVQHSRAEALASYAAKLEKVGDVMRRVVDEDSWPTVIDAWDAARKEKPGVIKSTEPPCEAVVAGPVDCDCNCERCPTVMIEGVPHTFNAGPEIAPGEVLL